MEGNTYTNTKFYLFFFLILIIIPNYFIEASIDGGSPNHDEQDINSSDFPSGFLFGAATSAYQIEGAFLEDGKSLSNWDVFNHLDTQSGNIGNVENGDIAVDYYHLYLKDIEIMHSLGIKAYRFSISWARVLPRGRFGDINPSGILFYNNIIDALLLKGIEPFVTIYHDDFPQELEDRYGSWLSPLMQEDFLHYAEICFKSFGDRVKNWITINEPNIVALIGYLKGQYPPARCSEPFGNCSAGNSDIEPLIVVHNMLLAHGKAAKLYRERFQPKQGGSIGIVAHCYAFRPLRDDVRDQEAANRASAFISAWVFDPVIFGDYPPEMRPYLGSDLPKFSAEEKKMLKNSIDFIGINHYSTLYAKDCLYSSCIEGGDRAILGFVNTTGERDGVPIGEPIPMPTFYVVPDGMKETINYLKTRYHNKPMFVTENGYCSEKQKDEHVEDVLQDVKRVEFHKSYLASLASAIRAHSTFEGSNSINGSKDDEHNIQRSDFPSGFLFGVATAAYQIEGAILEDGKSLNNWDVFNHAQENVENGDIADDHYHLYLKDIEIMHSLGIKAYRLSLSWARILPRGRFGDINPSGIMFYNNIIDNLLLKGIEPFVTLHHNDWPQELEDRYGSWLSPLMQEDFVLFAEICFKSFGDRVKYWVTINEPNSIAQMGYEWGTYPPARCSEPFGNCSAGNSDLEPLIAVHNMLLAHGKAVKLYRNNFQPKQGGFIGINTHCFSYKPFTDDKIGQAAADRALAFNIAWVYDPVIFGDYPPEMRHYLGSELPQFSPEEKKYMENSVDFIGINHYSALYAKDCLHSSCTLGGDHSVLGFVSTTGERDGVPIGEPTAMPQFFVVPKGMEEVVNYVKNRYVNRPMYITENGKSQFSYCAFFQKQN